jgi:lipoyl(octanoyl) transferase
MALSFTENHYILAMQWSVESAPITYPDALAQMEKTVRAIRAKEADEQIWLVEHPPLYSTGTSAAASDVLSKQFPVYETGRGGQVTYHGPGQRVVYLMLDLNKRGRDVRQYVQQLEQWIIATLAEFGVEGFTREGRIGVWVDVAAELEKSGRVAPKLREPLAAGVSEAKGAKGPLQSEAKIAALGVRVQGWVTSHGIAINVNPDLSHYAGIVPCGIREFGVTSLQALGVHATMDEVDAALKKNFADLFSTQSCAA